MGAPKNRMERKRQESLLNDTWGTMAAIRLMLPVIVALFTSTMETYLNVRQRSSGMMTKSAYHVTSVAIVVRVASVRRAKAQFSAFVYRPNILIHRVNLAFRVHVNRF